MSDFLILAAAAAVPFVSAVTGIILRRNPPGRNVIFGFRTKLSMSCDELWNTAQRLCGRLLTAVCAPLTVAVTAVSAVLLKNGLDSNGKFILMCVSVGVEIAALAAVNIAVERLLKKAGGRSE